jgi:hypothetical protein
MRLTAIELLGIIFFGVAIYMIFFTRPPDTSYDVVTKDYPDAIGDATANQIAGTPTAKNPIALSTLEQTQKQAGAAIVTSPKTINEISNVGNEGKPREIINWTSGHIKALANRKIEEVVQRKEPEILSDARVNTLVQDTPTFTMWGQALYGSVGTYYGLGKFYDGRILKSEGAIFTREKSRTTYLDTINVVPIDLLFYGVEYDASGKEKRWVRKVIRENFAHRAQSQEDAIMIVHHPLNRKNYAFAKTIVAQNTYGLRVYDLAFDNPIFSDNTATEPYRLYALTGKDRKAYLLLALRNGAIFRFVLMNESGSILLTRQNLTWINVSARGDTFTYAEVGGQSYHSFEVDKSGQVAEIEPLYYHLATHRTAYDYYLPKAVGDDIDGLKYNLTFNGVPTPRANVDIARSIDPPINLGPDGKPRIAYFNPRYCVERDIIARSEGDDDWRLYYTLNQQAYLPSEVVVADISRFEKAIRIRDYLIIPDFWSTLDDQQNNPNESGKGVRWGIVRTNQNPPRSPLYETPNHPVALQ